MSGSRFTRPDLCSMRAAIGQAESVGAVRGLLHADGYPLAGDHWLAPLARDAARTLVEAGFTLHHRAWHDPLHRLRGARLMLMPTESGTGLSAIAHSRTSQDLLLGSDLRTTCSRTCQLVNEASADVMHAPKYLDRRRGAAGACLVTSHRGQGEAGR